MFLALKEIKYEKFRYSLIIAMIVLISYLIFILTGLSLGLSNQNTDAINTWDMKSITLNKNADVSLNQSLISNAQADKLHLSKDEALLGQAGVIVKGKDQDKVPSQFLGFEPDSFVFKNMKLIKGHMPENEYQVVLDNSFADQYHYKLGEKIQLNSVDQKYKIVGFTDNAKINIAPVVYGRLSAWQTLKNISPQFKASGIVSKKTHFNAHVDGLKNYSKATFINKLPGYTAQNRTFEFMIGFLMIISLIVIGVFLYIITIQKLPHYAVLRAQGIPSSVLIKTTISQSAVLVISGLIIGAILTWLTAISIPAAVPMSFDLSLLSLVGLALLVISILGSLIPVKTILKVDPVSVIGG